MAITVPLKLTRIGNSRGVRIPAELIDRLGLDRAGLTAELRSDGLLLRAKAPKLSWAATAKAMAAEQENWGDWDAATADGLRSL